MGSSSLSKFAMKTSLMNVGMKQLGTDMETLFDPSSGGGGGGSGGKRNKNYKPQSLLQPSRNAQNATPVKMGGSNGLLS